MVVFMSVTPRTTQTLDILLEPLYSGQSVHLGDYPQSPIDCTRKIVDEAKDDENKPSVFCEMLKLHVFGNEPDLRFMWSETSRWIKFEETVEGGGKRWSKPHVTMLTLPRILQVRSCIRRGVVLLDLEASDFQDVVEETLGAWFQSGNIEEDQVELIYTAMMAPKHHQARSALPPRDRSVDSGSGTSTPTRQKPRSSMQVSSLLKADFRVRKLSLGEALSTPDNARKGSNISKALSDASIDRIGDRSSDRADRPRESSVPNCSGIELLSTSSSAGASSKVSEKAKLLMPAIFLANSQRKTMRKIAEKSVAANIFVGSLEVLDEPIAAFVRLKEQDTYDDIPEVAIPTKFIIIILAPVQHYDHDFMNVGRCFGALMVDEVFSAVALRARDSTELCNCIDEFLSQCFILPAGKWSPESRFDPAHNTGPAQRGVGKMSVRMSLTPMLRNFSHSHLQHHHHVEHHVLLHRTGRIFGGLYNDVRRKLRTYPSDIRDAFRVDSIAQCLASILFLFFANFTKIISFGGIMEHAFGNQINMFLFPFPGVMENILAGCLSGVLYALFAGQPLSILSVAGPVFAFESGVFKLCETYALDFLAVRCWIAVWTAVAIFVFVALDASVLASWITRFTEDAFATLISLIFIHSAIAEMIDIGREYPITLDPHKLLDKCVSDAESNFTDAWCKAAGNKTSSLLRLLNDTTSHASFMTHADEGHDRPCCFHPDVFLFSILLFVSTFYIAFTLKQLKDSAYFPTKVRNGISEFGVVIAIVAMTAVNFAVGLETPRLHIPEKFAPSTDRSWLVNPVTPEKWWICLLTIIPGVFFAILIIMNQHITAVILNRRENKLKKGYGYHLDLATLAVIFLLCGFFGLPFYGAGTVIAIMHIESLKIMSERAAPGEKPQFMGIREQRVTAFFAHVLVGLSVFMKPVIKLIPLPVLLGIVLYMGVASLRGQQFVQRLLILIMPIKHQPDYKFLRLLTIGRVHLFTFVQFACFLLLLSVQFAKPIAMFFPLALIVLIVVRKLLEHLFSPKELEALDNPIPSWSTMMKPHAELVHSKSFTGFKYGASQLPRISIASLNHTPTRTPAHENHEPAEKVKFEM